MLPSNPKQPKDSFVITPLGFSINSILIDFNELPIIYFANTIDNLRQSTNYDKRNYFFSDSKFNFNDQFMTLDNIRKQLHFLNIVNNQHIDLLIEQYNTITKDKLIQFYIDYVYYLVDKLNLLGLPVNSIMDIKYSLLLKNSELLSLLNNYNSNIISNLKNLYSDLIKLSK